MKNSLIRIWAIVARNLFSLSRDLERMAEMFWWPTFDVLIWGLMTIFLQERQGIPETFINLFIGAIVLWMFVYRAQQEMGVLFLREVWDRNILNILTTPLTMWEFLTATLIIGIVSNLISAIWMSLLAFFMFKFQIFTFGWMLIPFVINLLVVGWWTGFIINGLIICFGYRVQALAWTLVLIIQPFSAVFYPVSILPGWMQVVSKALPTSYIFEGMRQVLAIGMIDGPKILIAGLLNGIYLVLAILFFRYCFQKARENGMIVKFS